MKSNLPKRNLISEFPKDNNHKSSWLIMLRLCCMIVFALIIALLPANRISAATGLKLYDYKTKKNVTYTGKQVKVIYNGKKISKDSTPGIIEKGIALLSYKDIFDKSDINAECIYDKEKGTVTISQFGTTIVMTLYSDIAYVNGQKVTLPVAPTKVKYINENVTKILVPSRFVTETLGYKYTWNSSSSTVTIEKPFLWISYNDDAPFMYTGYQGQVSVDGQEIASGNMPSVVINNTALLRAKRIFGDSDIKAKYQYNKNNGTVRLTKDDLELEMTIGSTTAYLNGTAIEMDTAPMVVTNHEVNTSYVMVPGRFVATNLGFDYQWDANTATSLITSKNDNNDTEIPSNSETDDEFSDVEEPEIETEPELGDNPVIVDTGSILHQWNVDLSHIGMASGQHEFLPNDDNESLRYIYSVVRDESFTNNDNIAKLNVETFAISGTTPFGKVTSKSDKNVISINVTNSIIDNATYGIYGYSSYMVKNISTKYKGDDISADIEFDLVDGAYTYDISLSEDKMILYVSIYFNSIQEVVVGTNDNGDYIKISGLNDFDIDVTKQDRLLTINIPNVHSAFNNQVVEITNAKYINLLYLLGSTNYSQIVLDLDTCDYYIAENQNEYIILLGSSIGNELPKDNGNTDYSDDNSDGPYDNYEILIAKPFGIHEKDISHVDYYYNNQFSIIVPGDHRVFYANNPVIYTSSVIKDVSVFLNSNNQTEIRFTTTKLQGYKFDVTDKFIYVDIGNPKEIYKNIVVLDPGHGGPANGARYGGYKEKDINFKILYTLASKYFNSPNSNIKAYYTRIGDYDISLADRAAFAKKVGADLFVSLHMNAFTTSAPYGTEVYYSTNNNSPNSSGLTSKKMATLFVDNLCKKLGTYNRGAKSAGYTVVKNNTVPAVLIELAFMSNKNDLKLITDATFQEKTAQIIYETLCQVFELYPTKR